MSFNIKCIFFSILISIITLSINAHTVPVHHSQTSIYDFIDELANDKIIEINTAVKP